MKEELYSDSIYFVEIDKIIANPFQPRREFDQARLRELSESIRQYGILQPLVVSRVEEEVDGGGMKVAYELIAGERRLRASKLAGLTQVPAVIRKDTSPMMKLELAIIENLQREDLNPVDRARAFMRLNKEFGFSHKDIGKKVGKSRVYVSNSMRILQMPQDILEALEQKRITEGHTRPLLMLTDRPEEQMVLFKEIVYKKITVREAERIARNIAKDRARKKELIIDPRVEAIENEFQNTLGTRVHIKKNENGGNITIDFFTDGDLDLILAMLKGQKAPAGNPNAMMERHTNSQRVVEQDKVQALIHERDKKPQDSESSVDALVNKLASAVAEKNNEHNNVPESSVNQKQEPEVSLGEPVQTEQEVSQDSIPGQSTESSVESETEPLHDPVPEHLLSPRPLVEHEIVGEQAKEVHEEIDAIFDEASEDLDSNLDLMDDSSAEDAKNFETEDYGSGEENDTDIYNVSNFSL